jgi:hypothetical protein
MLGFFVLLFIGAIILGVMTATQQQ